MPDCGKVGVSLKLSANFASNRGSGALGLVGVLNSICALLGLDFSAYGDTGVVTWEILVDLSHALPSKFLSLLCNT